MITRKKIASGFTLIELIIVIVIIGILSTIGIVSYVRFQANARDTERSSKITILADALEKYYDKNGEYPSCSAMSQSVDTVTSDTLGGIDQTSLTTPTAADNTNSILPNCADLLDISDNFAYIGDSGTACLNTSCSEWTIKYLKESTGEIISVSSRHKTPVMAPVATEITATANGFTEIDLSWLSVNAATSYTIQQATNEVFTTNLVETSQPINSAVVGSLSQGTTYYFRVRANFESGIGNWSNTASATTQNLAKPVIAATSYSTSQFTTSWTSVDNASSYTIQRSTSADMSSPTTVSGLSTTNYSFTSLSADTTYYVRVTAVAGEISSSSIINSVKTLHLSTPTANIAADSTSQITLSWGAISMSTSYTVDYSTSLSFTSPTTTTGITTLNRAFTGLSANTTYYFRVKAVNANDNSSWSAAKSVATLHLATPTIASANTNSSTEITISWNSISMATGYTYNVSEVGSFSTIAATGTIASTTKTISGLLQGKLYYFRVNATNTNDTSGWSNTATATTAIDAPTAPSITAYLSGGTAYGSAGEVYCGVGASPYYQVAYNTNDGTATWPGWTGRLVAAGSNQGYKYGYWAYAYCQGANAASAVAGGNYASIVIPINTPYAPTYAGPGSFTHNVYAIVNYTTYCPAGTSVVPGSGTFRSRATWNNSYWGPHPFGFNDWWGNEGANSNVEYWGKYQCSTGYTTSDMSPESYVMIHVY